MGSGHITPYQTLSYQNRVYRLVAEWEVAYDLGPERERYIVLECDSTGVICEIHPTPYWISLKDYEGNVLGKFDTSGQLFVDEATRKGMLQVGDPAYPLDADPY